MNNKIEFGAICNCGQLGDVAIPKSVNDVHHNAFCECERLENIMGNDNIYIVENCYLIRNKQLISISQEKSVYNIPSGVETIGYGVFKNNLDATKIVLPNSVIIIEDDAFYNCSNLKDITLSENLKSIGNNCFKNCSSIESLYIPDTVESIGRDVFDGCISLSDLHLSVNVNFADDAFDLLTDAKIVIKDGLRYQGNMLLGPHDVTIESCECETPPVLDKDAFDLAKDNNFIIYVPSDKVDVYKNTDGWKEFASVIKAMD